MIRRRSIDVPRPRNRSCRAIVLNIVRDRSVDLTRKRVRSLCGVQHMVALGPRSLCGVQTGGSVDGVCIIQECVCRRYGGERRTIVMHMFRADAVPHTTTLFSPSLFLFRPRQPSLSVPILPPRSNPLRWFFGRWPTPTPSKNLLCSPPREPVSQRFHLFAKEVCEVYCVSRRGWSRHRELVSECRGDGLHLSVDIIETWWKFYPSWVVRDRIRWRFVIKNSKRKKIAEIFISFSEFG